MIEELKNGFISYAFKELQKIGKPNNPKQYYEFRNLHDLIPLLFELLALNVEEESLARVESNFYNHLNAVLNLNIEILPNSIEGLATNFEPFMKKIAYLKYKDTKYWQGTETSEGLKKTMLLGLYEGVISNKYNASEQAPKILLESPLVDYTGSKRTLLDFTRNDVRNSVHNARDYNRIELIHYSNIILGCYLIVIESNELFLKQQLFPEFKYLFHLINNKEFQSLDKVYVELLGKEELANTCSIGVDFLNEINLLNQIEQFPPDYEDVDIEETSNINENIQRIDSIISIAQDVDKFILIGSAGSGKSTTLKKILYNNAKKIYNGTQNVKLPILINANEYAIGNSFRQILSKKLDPEQIETKLKKGELQILIDGVNEISESIRPEAIKEINHLIRCYEFNSFVIAERKFNFENHFKLPVFEIKELDEVQIKIFIDKHSTNQNNLIWEKLNGNEELLELAVNPLMLKMIFSVIKQGEIPENKGSLYNLFINTIFQREKNKSLQIDREIKKDLLSFIAFTMREAEQISIPIPKFKQLIRKGCDEINSNLDINKTFKEFCDNNIIDAHLDDNVSFSHETFLEYFVGLYLNRQFILNGELSIETNKSSWYESVLFCGQLFNNGLAAIEFFKYLFKKDGLTHNPIPIQEFDENTFSIGTGIACKLAYSLRKDNPEAYNLACSYMKNYLILWKKIFYNKGIESISIENLFASISSLNSIKLFNYIFLNDTWIYIWLYSANDNYLDSKKFQFTDSDQIRLNKISSSICLNLPDPILLYEEISTVYMKTSYFRSVHASLKFLSNQIINYSTLTQLKKIYQRTNEFEVLNMIIKNDPSYVNYFQFDNENKNNGKRILKTLSTYHNENSQINDIVFKEIIKDKYSLNIQVDILHNYLLSRISPNLFTILEEVLKKNIKLFHELSKDLQCINFADLTEGLKNYYFNNLNNDKIAYSELKNIEDNVYAIRVEQYIELDQKKLSLENNDIDCFKIEPISHCIYFITVKLKNSDQFEDIGSIGEFKIIMKQSDESNESPDTYTSEINVPYSGYHTSSKGDKIHFLISKNIWQTLKIPNLSEILIDGKIEAQYCSKSELPSENIDHYIINFKINEKFRDRQESGYLKNSILIYSQPYLYHPDLIKSNSKLLIDIENNIENEHVQKFCFNIGISHLFHKKLPQICYGIVVEEPYKNNLKVYVFSRQENQNFIINQQKLKELKIDDIVVVDNSNLNVIQYNELDYDKIGFKTGLIIQINENAHIGFIYSSERITESKKDYFFSYSQCSFYPKVGDQVKFISILNPSKKYNDKPVAVKIEKISSPPQCRITSIFYSHNQNVIATAKDIDTGDDLKFITKNYLTKHIVLLNNDLINKNEIYEYLFLRQDNNENLIRLTKRKR